MLLTGFTAHGGLTALGRWLGVDTPVLAMHVKDMSLSVLVIPAWVLLLFLLRVIFRAGK